MRYVAVRRVTFVLGAALLLYAAAFVWLVDDQPQATTTSDRPVADGQPSAEGGALFQQHCAACHSIGDLAPELRDGGTNARSAAETFLRDHGDATDEEDRHILEYLSGPDAR
jgi:mono/diheme cytochrome c family protein